MLAKAKQDKIVRSHEEFLYCEWQQKILLVAPGIAHQCNNRCLIRNCKGCNAKYTIVLSAKNFIIKKKKVAFENKAQFNLCWPRWGVKKLPVCKLYICDFQKCMWAHPGLQRCNNRRLIRSCDAHIVWPVSLWCAHSVTCIIVMHPQS